MNPVHVTVSVDTEEDNWDRKVGNDVTVRNIPCLMGLQQLLAEYGARPTYLVNHAPLLDAEAVETLGTLAARDDVEIGAHCHPWNTPPPTGTDEADSWMCVHPVEVNRAMISEIAGRIRSELGVRPTTFRAGRWAFGPTVAQAVAAEGFEVDASVSPFLDWSEWGGPDLTAAPHTGYRFDPEDPLTPRPDGALIELPTTIGFISARDQRRAADRRLRLERSPLAKFHVVGVLDRMGILAYRWLSPEKSSKEELVRVAQACVASGQTRLDLSFHSCTLLPGATPWVQDDTGLQTFLGKIRHFLEHCVGEGYGFSTLSEEGARVGRA